MIFLSIVEWKSPNMQLETTEGQNHYTKDPCYAAFHDEEWGVPVHDDMYHHYIF